MSPPEARAPRIIAVDDDALVLGSLKGLFTLETDYAVELFDDPRKAVEHLAKNPVDVVISDFLMPQMNGLEFDVASDAPLAIVAAQLFGVSLTRQRLFQALLFTRFQVIRVALHFLNDIFLLDFSLESAQRVINRFAV